MNFLRTMLPASWLTLALGLAMPAWAADKVLVGAFDLGPGGNPQKFNPLTASAGFTWYNKYFGTLALYDAGFQQISGDLAQSWLVSPDGKAITFKLRKDVKWHDGKPLVAKDVKFTIDLARHPDSGSAFAARLDGISSVRVPDDETVVLELATANTAILDTLTSLMILPAHHLAHLSPKDLRNSDWWQKTPVGTGPFRWHSYVPDQYVELAANPHYYRGRPKLDKLVNRYFKDGGTAAIALQAGEIQFSYLTLDQVKGSPQPASFKAVSGASQVLNYLGFNNKDPRFKDVRVRQAMLMAIDRQAIIKNLYSGQAQAGDCIYTQKQFLPAGLNPYAYDPSKARKLLAEAGWAQDKNSPIELLTYYGDQLSKDVAAVIQAQLAEIGVLLRPRFVDAPTFTKQVDAGKFALVFAGAGNGPEPDSMAPLMDSAFVPPKGLNRMRINIPELDQLFDAGRKEVNPAKRPAIYQNVCQLTNAQLPLAPLWVTNRFGGISTKVQNMVWTPAPGGGRYHDNAESWTLP